MPIASKATTAGDHHSRRWVSDDDLAFKAPADRPAVQLDTFFERDGRSQDEHAKVDRASDWIRCCKAGNIITQHEVKGQDMSADARSEAVKALLDAVGVSLYEGVIAGLAASDAQMEGVGHREDYPWLASAHSRVGARNYWRDNGIGDGWMLGGNPRLMGQTLLHHAGDGVVLRLLKERRGPHPGGVPAAGPNDARREQWQQPPLAVDVRDASQTPDQVVLLLLWDRQTQDERDLVTVRAVHTLAPGAFGRAVPIDMSFDINPSGTVFDRLAYRGDDQPDNFFAHIDEADNEGTGTDHAQ